MFAAPELVQGQVTAELTAHRLLFTSKSIIKGFLLPASNFQICRREKFVCFQSQLKLKPTVWTLFRFLPWISRNHSHLVKPQLPSLPVLPVCRGDPSPHSRTALFDCSTHLDNEITSRIPNRRLTRGNVSRWEHHPLFFLLLLPSGFSLPLQTQATYCTQGWGWRVFKWMITHWGWMNYSKMNIFYSSKQQGDTLHSEEC